MKWFVYYWGQNPTFPAVAGKFPITPEGEAAARRLMTEVGGWIEQAVDLD